MFGRGLGSVLCRSKSTSDLPDAFHSSPNLTRVSKTSKHDQSFTLEKNPVDHAGGLETNLGRRNSWETDDTLVADRRESLGSLGSSHDPSKAIEVPPYGFVSERRPANWRQIRNIWQTFKRQHPKSAKLVKWTAWLLGAAATTGGSVLLSEEIKKLYRQSDKNLTFEQLDERVHIITNEFECLLNASEKEFERRPSPGIFDLYFNPVERVKRGKRSDFIFDFEKLTPTTEFPKKEFFPNRNETFVCKHSKNTNSEIVHFNDSSTSNPNSDIIYFNESSTTENFIFTTKDILQNQKEKPTETSTTLTTLLGKEGTVITYKIFEVSIVLIVVGALTIITLAFVVMCCFCYGCKSRERRYTNQDTVRARVIAREPNVPSISNVLPSVNLYSYDTPQGASLNRPNHIEHANAHANANFLQYEMVDVELDDSQSTGLPNRANYHTQNQPTIFPASQGPAVSTGQRRLISAF